MRWWERVIPAVVTALVFGAGYGWAGDISYPGGPSGSLLSGTVVDGDDVELSFRTHATDCTSLTDGVVGEPCINLDDHDVFVCEPTAGACDSATEWVQKTTRKHATDCTSLTDGKQGQFCQNTDDNKVFVCNPTAGDCSGAEWIEIPLATDVHNDHGLLTGLTDNDHVGVYPLTTSGTTDPRTGSVNCTTIADVYTYTSPTPDLVFDCLTIGATGVWRLRGEALVIADRQTTITLAGECAALGTSGSIETDTDPCTTATTLFYFDRNAVITSFAVMQRAAGVDNAGCKITLEEDGTDVTGSIIYSGDSGGTGDIDAPGETSTKTLSESINAGSYVRVIFEDDDGTHCDNAGPAACDCDTWDIEHRIFIRAVY